MSELQIYNPSDDVAEVRNFRAAYNRGVGMNGSYFILHNPARHVEIMDRVGIEEHAVHVGLVGGDGRFVLVAAQGFENQRLADFACIGFFSGRCIRRIVSTHEAYLQTYSSTLHSFQSVASLSQIKGQGLLAENVFAGRGGGAD